MIQLEITWIAYEFGRSASPATFAGKGMLFPANQ